MLPCGCRLFAGIARVLSDRPPKVEKGNGNEGEWKWAVRRRKGDLRGDGFGVDRDLVPGGRAGTWICGSLGFTIVLVAIIFSVIPPGDTSNRTLFLAKVALATIASILLGLILYWRGARSKAEA